mgnify:CR=1 FL=1
MFSDENDESNAEDDFLAIPKMRRKGSKNARIAFARTRTVTGYIPNSIKTGSAELMPDGTLTEKMTVLSATGKKIPEEECSRVTSFYGSG